LWFPDGEYIDTGTLEGLRRAQQMIAVATESDVAR
jgi:hypothetical protein